MTFAIATSPDGHETRTSAWVGPFAVFVLWLAVDKYIPLANPAKEIARDTFLIASILFFSRRILATLTAPNWFASVLIGVAVFVMWIAPDVLIPGWRAHAIFQNSITGRISLSIPPDQLSPVMLALRTARAALLVPVLEECFWRGWLPRFVQGSPFYTIPLGQYTPLAFWATALLFAADNVPIWEVG
jgi:CAAX prenyl protease-like protein